LEPYKEYKFEVISDIHENILNLLNILMTDVANKENELSIHKTKQNIGLNIDNFVTSFNYNIIIMKEKIAMFISYIEFFHKMHTKYLKRFSNKIQLMHTHINNDIKFDETIEMNLEKKKEIIDDYERNNTDKNLMKDLKKSLNIESNSDDSDKENTQKMDSLVHPESDIESRESTPKTITNNSISSEIISRQNTDESVSTGPKRNLKEILKKNVRKVTGLLRGCGITFNKNAIKSNVSNNDLESMFLNINSSCDSIIQNNNIELTVEENQHKNVIINQSIANEVVDVAEKVEEVEVVEKMEEVEDYFSLKKECENDNIVESSKNEEEKKDFLEETEIYK
jgi:hypothetical protein